LIPRVNWYGQPGRWEFALAAEGNRRRKPSVVVRRWSLAKTSRCFLAQWDWFSAS
jgi:hypothetical protein